MLLSAKILRFSKAQMSKLSDIFAGTGQVFLASIVLPSLGFGGKISTSGMFIGTLFSLISFAIGLRLVQSSSHDNDA